MSERGFPVFVHGAVLDIVSLEVHVQLLLQVIITPSQLQLLPFHQLKLKLRGPCMEDITAIAVFHVYLYKVYKMKYEKLQRARDSLIG